MNPPETWSATPSYVQGLAPNLGEHTIEILTEIGMSQKEIDAIL
jgi:crotonobetainyl-CoA:carnitine CoA-transferase CaiB-like acyl-CoA transferase